MMKIVHEDKDVWFVWTKGGRRPRFAHPSKSSAITEAERLAKKHPDRKFLVMHVVDKVSVVN